MTTCELTLYCCPEWGDENIKVASEQRSDLSPFVLIEATRYGDQNRTHAEFHVEKGCVGTLDLMGHIDPVTVDYASLCDELALAGVGYGEACATIDLAIDWVVKAAARSKLRHPEVAGGS
jgi:hypothetical protein